MTPSRVQARAKNRRSLWVTVTGFGAQVPIEGRGAHVPALGDTRVGEVEAALTVRCGAPFLRHGRKWRVVHSPGAATSG